MRRLGLLRQPLLTRWGTKTSVGISPATEVAPAVLHNVDMAIRASLTPAAGLDVAG